MTRSIDICICTFQRPQLADILKSLAAIAVPSGFEVRVIVIDNDRQPSGKTTAMSVPLPFAMEYIHAPSGNISIARNAALDHATGDFLAFLDDDETVSPDWLVALCDAADQTGADIVFGPVVARYPDYAAGWIVAGNYHATRPPEGGATIKTGCSANVLIRRVRPDLVGLRFDLSLGKSGGEDTVYFRQAHAMGAVMGFCDSAIVYEDVAANRLSLAWLASRKFRSGQSHARAEIATSRQPVLQRCKLAVGACAKAVICGAAALLSLPSEARRNSWMIRGSLHLGVVAFCMGMAEHAHYGLPDPAPITPKPQPSAGR